MNKKTARKLFWELKKGNMGYNQWTVRAQMKKWLHNGMTAPAIQSQHNIEFTAYTDTPEEVYKIVMATGEYKNCKVFGSGGRTQIYPVIEEIDYSDLPF